ncbi:hypothetical protein [Streptomyces sp. NBC_00258]|uniref:hypothetical protein n=1 Tax=Streptomyces sp. NBC_00258 TaxID=2903642 RepID=UPI002E27BD46|nr:hypothetical protein [Streptomyces sp. NBC_00258]
MLPQLYAATAPDARSGQLFGPDGWKDFRGYPTRVRPGDASHPDTARWLWDLSEELTGVRYAIATPRPDPGPGSWTMSEELTGTKFPQEIAVSR